MVFNVPSMVCWRPVVPQRIMATGVFSSMPLAVRACEISRMRVTPMRMILVPGVLAACAQSAPGSIFSGSSWPVKTVKLEQ